MEFAVERVNSKYNNVSFDKTHGLWIAVKIFEGKRIYIGGYKTEEEAALEMVKAVHWYTNVYNKPTSQSTNKHWWLHQWEWNISHPT